MTGSGKLVDTFVHHREKRPRGGVHRRGAGREARRAFRKTSRRTGRARFNASSLLNADARIQGLRAVSRIPFIFFNFVPDFAEFSVEFWAKRGRNFYREPRFLRPTAVFWEMILDEFWVIVGYGFGVRFIDLWLVVQWYWKL